MTTKFTLGAMAGASALALSFPIVLQLASAASLGASSPVAAVSAHPVPSQACVTAMARMEDHFLQYADAMMAAHKTAAQAHKNALLAAAQIADDTQRAEALKKAHEDRHAAMQAAMDAQDQPTEAMDAMKTACGDTFLFKMKGHGGRGGPGMGMFMKPFGKGPFGRGYMMKMQGEPAPTQQ